MNKVTTINLSGKAYNVEEKAYEAFSNYLKTATETLAANPDKEEILKDLESAIADRCETYLSGAKNVIEEKEAKAILDAIGSVEASENKSGGSEEKSQDKTSMNDASKKFYRIREGSIISGVCMGLAVYFNIDVVIMRIIFVVLSMMTGGGMVGVYIILLIITPVADTPEEKNAAYGGGVTAQMLIERAKNEYNHFANKEDWKKWKSTTKNEWRQWRREHHDRAKTYQSDYTRNRSPFWEFANSLLGMLWVVFMLFIAVFAYHHFPLFQQLIDTIFNDINHFFGKF